MTIERELLKRIAKYRDTIPPEFIYEICELLAQHEQTEQEPVAWMWDEMFCEDWTTVSSVIKPSKSKYVDNVRPLYLAPPKREPLINIYVLNAFKADDEATHPYSYWAGVEFAEKHHGIGGGCDE